MRNDLEEKSYFRYRGCLCQNSIVFAAMGVNILVSVERSFKYGRALILKKQVH